MHLETKYPIGSPDSEEPITRLMLESDRDGVIGYLDDSPIEGSHLAIDVSLEEGQLGEDLQKFVEPLGANTYKIREDTRRVYIARKVAERFFRLFPVNGEEIYEFSRGESKIQAVRPFTDPGIYN